MSNNKQQVSHWYNGYQICLYPMEQTLRCPDTYSQQVLVWGKDREIIYDRYFNTDEIFWSDVATQEKMLVYIKKVIDNLTSDIPIIESIIRK
jgi:hypothetical protein